MCNFCDGSETLYKDEQNSAFVDGNGTMHINANGHEMSFSINRCPMCGRMFKVANIPHDEMLCTGDEIWYVDVDAAECYIEHARVEYVEIENGSVDWFSTKFDNGDIDQFGPCALGQFCFKSYEAAQSAWNKKHIDVK